MKVYSDNQPKVLEKLINNKYYFRWNIQQETKNIGEDEEGESIQHTQYVYDEVVFEGQPSSNIILEAAIRSFISADEEKKLINDYNAYKENLLIDEKYKNRYMDFLSKRSELKSAIEQSCTTLNLQ